MIFIMEDRVGWFAMFACFSAIFLVVAADDIRPGNDARTGQGRRIARPTCEQLCAELNIKDGCERAPLDAAKVREEVIVMTNGSSSIQSWDWDTITMVVTTYFHSISSTGLTSCVAHSKGKRYGLRERVPGSDNLNQIMVGDVEKVKGDFIRQITTYFGLLRADHMVFDLLNFFQQLDTVTSDNKTYAIDSLNDILVTAVDKVKEEYNSQVFCVVPWKPPCEQGRCEGVRKLLGNCEVMVLSPDSYLPSPDHNNMCLAQATIPIAQFLYGVDRYLALRARPFVQGSIVAGIPWHGYSYKCDKMIDDKCMVQSTTDECFSSSNRQRYSLSEIHSMNIADSQVKMDEVNKGIYFNKNEMEQIWYENFTTLFIKYQLVKDLRLKGLSIWYGEDMVMNLNAEETPFAFKSWDFLTHQVLHKATYDPPTRQHVFADTVAGIAIGCLLLGTALGVTFTYIAMRRKSFGHTNRPFKLDEVDDEFRDDEGL